MKKEDLQTAYQKLGINKKVDPNFELSDFWSTCCVMICAEWFFQFQYMMFDLFTQTDKSTVQLGQEAYTEVLGPKHGWFTRTTVNLAINLINSRETFNDSLIAEQTLVLGRPYSKAELHTDMVEMRRYLKNSRDYITKFNKDRGVDNLLSEKY